MLPSELRRWVALGASWQVVKCGIECGSGGCVLCGELRRFVTQHAEWCTVHLHRCFYGACVPWPSACDWNTSVSRWLTRACLSCVCTDCCYVQACRSSHAALHDCDVSSQPHCDGVRLHMHAETTPTWHAAFSLVHRLSGQVGRKCHMHQASVESVRNVDHVQLRAPIYAVSFRASWLGPTWERGPCILEVTQLGC